MSAPASGTLPAQGARLWLAVTLALLALRAAIGALAVDRDGIASPSPLAHLVVFAMNAAPHAAALALLAARRTTIGLGVAFGAALVTTLTSAPLLLVWLQQGDRGATPATLAAGLVAGLTVPVQILLGNAAWRAARALGAPARRVAASWLAAAAAPFAFHALAAGAVYAAWVDWGALRAQRHQEAAAQSAVERVARCVRDATARDPAAGVPATLAALGPSGTGCLDANTVEGRVPGYLLVYLPGVPDAAGRHGRFAVCAQPLDLRRGGVNTWVAGADGRVASYVPSTSEDVEAGRALPCAGPWFLREQDALRGIEVCLLEWAAAHPESGYPRSLRALGPEGNGCIQASGAPVLTDTRFGVGPGAIEYAPAAPGPDGVVRELALRAGAVQP